MSINLNSRIEERLKAMGIDTTGMSDEDKFFNATGLTLCHDECIEKLAKEEYYVPGGAANVPNKEPEHDYSQDYLTLVALEDGTFSFYLGDSDTYMDSISYSIDNGETWVTYDGEDRDITALTTPTITTGNKVLWKGVGKAFGDEASHFESTGTFNAQGNIMSLLCGDDFTDKTQFDSEYQYQLSGLFENSKVVDANNLILPATTLANHCYQYMFQDCTSLTTAPELLATTLAESCYSYMFYGCANLTTAPELPATELADYCYEYMFHGCTSLTTAPQLPATTLTSYCYYGMFNGCTSLTTAPELPAITLAQNCYQYMFDDCTSLTTAPQLPATTLENSCYGSMFNGCTSLTTAPQLPATTLAESCYEYMFHGCTNLTTAPELLATTLASECYSYMFYGCTSLNYITCLATNISASDCTNSWVSGVPASGTFTKAASMTNWTTGTSGIPSGWTVQDAD